MTQLGQFPTSPAQGTDELLAVRPLPGGGITDVLVPASSVVALVGPVGGAVTLSSPDNSVDISGSPGSVLAVTVAAAFEGALNVLPGTFTYASLPAASSQPRKYAVTTDQGAVYSNGAYWQILFNITTGSLAISSNSPLTPATQGGAYTNTLTATAGVVPYTWSLVSVFGASNSWSLSSAGVLTGTPGTLAIDSLMVQVSDSTGAVTQKLLTLETVVATTPAATPTFLPVAGTYIGTQNVVISCTTPSSTIYYTTNGSTPTTGSTVYSGPVSVAVSETLKAIATAGGFTQSAVGSAAYVINSSANPIGVNFAARGGTARSSENFPFLKNRWREGRGFCDSATATTPLTVAAGTLGTDGWPIGDFATIWWEGTVIPSWLSSSSTSAPFKCGFLSTTGTETIAVRGATAVIQNIVHHVSPSYTTYEVYANGIFGITITGTGGLKTTNHYCYLPGYDLGTIDDPTAATAFTAEAILQYSQYRHLRAMKMSFAEGNIQVSSSTTRRKLSNCQSTQKFGNNSYALTAAPGIHATSATLTANWLLPSGQYCLPMHSPTLINPRICTLTNGATTVTWSDALTEACDTAGLVQFGLEGYPIEWLIGLCNACNIGIWICTPALEDGPQNAAGSWSTEVMTYLAANWTSSGDIYFEMGNENWNFGSPAAYCINGMSQVYGYHAISGDNTLYYAYRLHAFANMCRSFFPVTFGTRVKQVLCHQTTQGGMFYIKHILDAIAAIPATPSADVQLIATAPYMNPILTNSDSIGTIEAAVATNAATQCFSSWCENDAITGIFYGMQFASYESGCQWNGSGYSAVTNLGAAIQDAGYVAPMQAYFQAMFNSGYQFMSHFGEGVSSGNSVRDPIDEYTKVYASPLLAPTLTALQSFMSGLPVPTRNVVNGSGSVINGANYADNTTVSFATFALNNTYAPHQKTGYAPFIVNCTVPGTYALVATFSGCAGSPVTDVECNGSVLSSGVAVSNGAIALGNVTLLKGTNYVCLGHNGSQTATITQLQFN